jgi:hypothetical protein
MTNRGTRTPPVTRSNVDSPVGSQPRRGERTDFVSVSIAMSMPAGDGLRRGTR